MRTGKKAFTLVELLVVISIIALLLAVLIPALSRAKLLAERVVCGTHLKDAGTAFLAYASMDNDGKLPIGAMGGGLNAPYTVYLDGTKWSMLNYITEPTWVALKRHVKDTRTLMCSGYAKTKACTQYKNFLNGDGGPFVPDDSTWNPPAYKLGYNYHGGHFAGVWNPDARDERWNVKRWVSPFRVSDRGSLVLFSDMITVSDNSYGTFIAHSSRGSITGTIINQDPMKLSSNSGGNVGSLDGSVKWKALRDMSKYHRAKNFGNASPYCSTYPVNPGNVISFGYW